MEYMIIIHANIVLNAGCISTAREARRCIDATELKRVQSQAHRDGYETTVFKWNGNQTIELTDEEFAALQD